MSEHTWWEKIGTEGSKFLEQLRRLIDEGNVRRIVVKQGDRTVAEFPLTVGVVGAAIAPVLAAIGAIAAVLSHCTIEVEKTDSAPKPDDKTTPSQGANM
jgi:hypothetical protein